MRLPIIPYNPKLKERARELRKKMTLAETLLWKRLKGKQLCGYDFDRQRPIGRRIVDFYCKELKLAVDVDGSVHDFRRKEDEQRQRELETLGVTLLRFWNYEVKNNMASVTGRIEERIRCEEQRRGWPRREVEPTPDPSEGGERSSRDRATSERTRTSSPPGRGPGWVQHDAVKSNDPSSTPSEQTNAINCCDVLIIGGGPAGSAAATVLAGHGHKVLLLEREKFPRYHIGESLLPFTFQPLQRLGLIEKMRKSAFIKKYSVQFVSPSGKASQPFYFFTRYDRDTVAQTWQVLRSEFDVMLLDNAREKGASVKEETTVKELMKEGGRVVGVRAQDKGGKITEYRAPITLDCSGREAFSAVRHNWRVGDPELHKVAVWTYYKGAKRDEGIDAGTTTVAFVPEKGWFWYIPLHDDIVSVGVVAEGKYLTRDGVKEPEQIFKREIEQNLWIKEYVSCGTQFGPFYITGEFSFHSRYCGVEGLLLVGDAYCFLDPVFSSGVMLALKSGAMAGDAVHEALLARDFSPERFADYATKLREGIENMRKLVYAFYNPNFSFRELTDKHPDLAGDVTDCLSGDVNKDFSRLWTAIEEFADVPKPLPYGQPLANAKAQMQPAQVPLNR